MQSRASASGQAVGVPGEQSKGRQAARLLVGVLLAVGIALVVTAIALVSLVEVTTTENVYGEDRPSGVVVETTCGTILDPVLDCDANRDRLNQASVVFGVGLLLCAIACSAWALVAQRRPLDAIVRVIILVPLAIGTAWLWRSLVIALYEHNLS